MAVSARFTEAEAHQILSYGPRAKAERRAYRALVLGVCIPLGILMLPAFGVGAYFMYEAGKECLSNHRKFEYLALDDPRFELFVDLAKNDITSADHKWRTHKDFYDKLVQTEAFITTFASCLKDSSRKSDLHEIDCWIAATNANSFIDFFVSRNLVDQSFNRYRLDLEQYLPKLYPPSYQEDVVNDNGFSAE